MRGRRERNDGGAAAVEFALILIPIMVVLFGLVQYGLYFYSAQTGSNTVNAAVRQLAVGNCQNAATFRTYIGNQLGAAKADTNAQLDIRTTWKNVAGTTVADVATAGVGGTVTLTIIFHSINMHFPLVPFLSESWVERTAQARVEDTAQQGCGS